MTTAPDRAQDVRTPSPLLFEFDDVDLNRVVFTRSDLERWNPHRGPIVQLDAVIWHDETFSKAIGYKDVREDEFWTSGHFPGNPIMPGVLQIEAGAQLTSFMFYNRRGEPCIVGFTRIENTVFRGKVRPGDRLLILSREIKYRPRIFISAIQGLVDGKVVFESKITGMVI
jgi:3-hydroxyacyl-[acyl-carrier-protein] dehydratase